MTNRYVTEAEKEGHRRRMAEYRARKRAAGVRARQITASEAEEHRIRQILAAWRNEETMLDEQEKEAALVLRPAPAKPGK